MHVRDFQVQIPEGDLTLLQEKLRSTRLPATLAADTWDDGTSVAFMSRLLEYWKSGYDWRAVERRINALPQFHTDLDGLDIHFVHARGNGPAPLPLILTHGWPGSFLEMERILPMLTDPGAHGGDPADAFDVVVPSLPGFGFSQGPQAPGVGPQRVAALWLQLMQQLGYTHFGVQGGDIGAGVSSWLAREYPGQVLGIHLNFISGSYRPPLGAGYPPVTAEEQTFLDTAAAWGRKEGAYVQMQGTKPQTVAFALTDSPIGLAAWIVEKLKAWSDCGDDIESTFSLDDILTDVHLYWFGDRAMASTRFYKESMACPLSFENGDRVLPPLGVALFPRELPMPPRSWVERVYDVRRWDIQPRGGHFAAFEEPALLAESIRAHFRPLRSLRA